RRPRRRGPRAWSRALAAQAVAADGAEERHPVHARAPRGLGDVAARLLQQPLDVVTLEALEELALRGAQREAVEALERGRHGAGGRGRGGLSRRLAGLSRLPGEGRGHPQDEELLEVVAQLAHVAGPGVARERLAQ